MHHKRSKGSRRRFPFPVSKKVIQQVPVGVIRLLIALLLAGAGSRIHAASLPVYVLSADTKLDFTIARSDWKIGQFLVVNSDVSKRPTIVFTSGRGCNVEHFRRSDLAIPLKDIRLTVNGVLEPLPRLWTRGADCGVLSWSPAVAGTYESLYQIDVLASWDAKTVPLAGTYSESINLVAYTP